MINNELLEETLYENSSTSNPKTITLSKDISQFNKVKIYWISNNWLQGMNEGLVGDYTKQGYNARVDCVCVYGTGATSTLTTSIRCMAVLFSGTTVTLDRQRSLDITPSATTQLSMQVTNTFVINKIIGLK